MRGAIAPPNTMKTIEEIKERCREAISLGEAATKGPWIPSVWGTQILTGDSWQTICVCNEMKNDHRLAEWEDGSGKPKHNAANANLLAFSRTFSPLAAKALLAVIEHAEYIRTDAPGEIASILDEIRENWKE